MDKAVILKTEYQIKRLESGVWIWKPCCNVVYNRQKKKFASHARKRKIGTKEWK